MAEDRTSRVRRWAPAGATFAPNPEYRTGRAFASTDHLAADAVSSLTTDSSASGSFGSSLVDATVSKSGGYFRVFARGRVKSNGNDEVYVYLKRGSTTIATWSKWCGNANYEDFAFNVAESPSDGSTTYSITISGTSYGGAYQSLSLEVEYHKR